MEFMNRYDVTRYEAKGGWSLGRSIRRAAVTVVAATLLVTAGSTNAQSPSDDRPNDGPPTPEQPAAVGPTGETQSAEAAASGSQSAPSLYLGLDSRLWIEGTSTVRDFTCEAGVVAATLRAGPGDDPLSLEDLNRAVGEARLQIPGAQLDCDNDTMNDHMWEALEVEEHSDIRFGFDDYRIVEQSGDSATLELPGRLTMAGVTRRHTVTAHAIPQEDGSLRVAGSTAFPMTEWEVEPPSLMFGLMKVGDEVEVHFDLVVRRQEPNTTEEQSRTEAN